MSILDWVYPPKCLFCQNIIPINEYIDVNICNKCMEHIPWDTGKSNASIFYDDMVKSAIYRFKYGNCPQYAKTFSWLMYKTFIEKVDRKIDYLVPVPIHKARQKQRGYNQAKLLSLELSKRIHIQTADILMRVRQTKPQSTLDAKSRKNNLHNAFALKEKVEIEGKSLLIIDDILTTGATIEACMQAIIDKNRHNGIYYYVLASGS